MSNFLRKAARTTIKEAIDKSSNISKKKGMRARKIKSLYKFGTTQTASAEKQSVNSVALAKALVEYCAKHYPTKEATEADSTINEGINELLQMLDRDSLRILGLFNRIEKNYFHNLTLALERINSYLNEIEDNNRAICIMSLLVLVFETNYVYGTDILVDLNKYATIVYPILKHIEANYKKEFSFSSSLQKKINNIENDYTKGYVLKSIVKKLNNTMLDLMEHLKLDKEIDHIIEVSSELLVRCVEVSNTYSLIDKEHNDDKANLEVMARLSYYYVIYKEYEEKHNYLKQRILKDITSFFTNSDIYKDDALNNEALAMLNTIVNYDYNNTSFFIEQHVTREEIVKPIYKIFYVALSDLLTITRIIDTYSEKILVTDNENAGKGNEFNLTKNEYLEKLLDMLNDYRRFLLCNDDSFSPINKLYYLTYSIERVTLIRFIADLDLLGLEKFLKEHNFFKQYKKCILF